MSFPANPYSPITAGGLPQLLGTVQTLSNGFLNPQPQPQPVAFNYSVTQVNYQMTPPGGYPMAQPGGNYPATHPSNIPIGLQGLLVPGQSPEGFSPLQGSGGFFFPSATINWSDPRSQLGTPYF